MASDDDKKVPAENGVSRRDVLKNASLVAAGLAASSLTATQAAADPQQDCVPTNPYNAPPGSGISMPPYYKPTPSIKNRNTYFPQTEEVGADEMRITFMGSNPWPPRQEQAGTCIMVELGNGKRFFFDFGSGCLRNIIGNQVPVPEINDIFLSHLHVDHFADLPYLYAFAPSIMHWKPLRVYGPSGRTPELGTKSMIDSMKKMCNWHRRSFECLPVGEGYEVEVTEFDFKDEGGICYNTDDVTVRHWQRSHTMDGASAYRLDWNGLSFVWTGDGKPDTLSAKYGKGADLFVSEMVLDMPAIWALQQGLPEVMAAFTIDSAHSPGYGVGYLGMQVKPRLLMATHYSFDIGLLNEASAEVRTYYDGIFALGIDHQVVNVTKDAIWVRTAALPVSASTAKPSPKWMVLEMFGGVVPKEISFPDPKYTVADNQNAEIRALEIPQNTYTPKNQIRPWVREWPKGIKASPAALLGGPPPEKK